MDTQLQLLIEMRDKLSKPLTDQQKALKGVNQQIKDLIKTQKLEEQAQAKAIKDQAKAKKAAEEWSKAVGSEMVAAVEVGAAAVAALAVGVGVLTLGLVGAIAKTIEFTSAQAAMGEKLAASYTLFTRDAEQAGKTRDMIDDLAARMHLAPDKLHDTAHELLAAGIKPQLELQRSVAAITALQKTGNDDAAGKLKRLLTRGAQSRRQFGGQGFIGISRNEAVEALGVGGFEQLQEAIRARGGKALRTGYNSLMTTADVANKALADVITGGKVGEAARKMVGGLPEVFARLSAEIRRFFQGLSQGEGFRKFIESLHGVIDVLEAFGKQGGAKSTVSILDSGFKLLAKGIDRGTILLIDMVTWFYNLAAAALETYNSFKKWLSQGNRMEFLKGALIGIAVVFGLILLVVGAVALALAAVVAFMLIIPLTIAAGFAGFIALFAYIYSISDQFKALFSKDAWKNAIADWIDGLVSGIRRGITAITSAGKALGDALKNSVKGALDAHSPSREMMKIGGMAREGFQIGLDGGGQSFSVGAIKPSLGVGARGGASITWTGDVIIQGGGGATAEELKPIVDSAFADAFERLQLEMGSA